MKDKLELKSNFSKIELLIIIFVALIIITIGIILSQLGLEKTKKNNFVQEVNLITNIAKNSYLNIASKNNSYIVSESNYNAMCITINGLQKNGYLDNNLDEYKGYIVIEEKDNNYNYTVWLSNKDYQINGYANDKIKEGLEKNNNSSYELTDTFTGTTSTKGGTGYTDSSITYHGTCIDSKIEEVTKEEETQTEIEESEQQ